jgi:hypothetical protein
MVESKRRAEGKRKKSDDKNINYMDSHLLSSVLNQPKQVSIAQNQPFNQSTDLPSANVENHQESTNTPLSGVSGTAVRDTSSTKGHAPPPVDN